MKYFCINVYLPRAMDKYIVDKIVYVSVWWSFYKYKYHNLFVKLHVVCKVNVFAEKKTKNVAWHSDSFLVIVFFLSFCSNTSVWEKCGISLMLYSNICFFWYWRLLSHYKSELYRICTHLPLPTAVHNKNDQTKARLKNYRS